MKNILLSTLLFTTSIFSFGSLHAATTSSSMDVNANIQKVCYFRTLMNINFDYKPEATQDLTRDVLSHDLFEVKCNAGLSPILSMSGSESVFSTEVPRELTGADNQKLNYVLSFHDGGGTQFTSQYGELNDGAGSSVLTFDSFYFNFRFPKGQFVKGQSYSETITLTLSY